MRKIILLLSLILLVSCGNKSEDKFENTSTVQYTVDDSGCLNSVSVNDYDDSTVFVSDNYYSVDYIWQCTEYKGQSNIYVSLGFSNNSDGSNCLKFNSEYVSSGICY